MVKLLQVVLYRSISADKTPVRLASATDLSSFSYFARRTLAEHLRFATRTICQRTAPGVRQSVALKDVPYSCHVHQRSDGLCAIAVTDNEYNVRVAFSLLQKCLADFEKATNGKWKECEKDDESEPDFLLKNLTQYQNPEEADKMTKIQKNLDEIKDIMHKNIDEVLKRGETIDALMERSNDLSSVSVQFYKKAKKTNQCCKAY